MERYLMYLRKSRMDTDFDDVSVEETLNRPSAYLGAFCKERRLNVVETLEEVVSGESLSARPKMLHPVGFGQHRDVCRCGVHRY